MVQRPRTVARNIEIKARVRDWDALRARVEALCERPPVRIEQHDTFFRVPAGRLKLRRLGPGDAQLIRYVRPDDGGPAESRYTIAPTSDPDALEAILSSFLPVAGLVAKTRLLYIRGRTRIHLDQVDGLGRFVELEVVLEAGEPASEGEAEARKIMQALGIEEDELVAEAYVDLIAAAR
jgi:predicted adenylyl cyclase CyaB